MQRANDVRPSGREEEKGWRTYPPDLRTSHVVAVINPVWCWHKDWADKSVEQDRSRNRPMNLKSSELLAKVTAEGRGEGRRALGAPTPAGACMHQGHGGYPQSPVESSLAWVHGRVGL